MHHKIGIEPEPLLNGYEVRHQCHNLDDVMQFFVDGFKPKNAEIMGHRFWVDAGKNQVVFELQLRKKPRKRKQQIVYGPGKIGTRRQQIAKARRKRLDSYGGGEGAQ